MTKAKAAKTVSIIARIEFRADTRKICYLVNSSNGVDQYETCLFDGKATSCSCPSQRSCYHMQQLEEREAKRVVVMVGGQKVSGANADHAVLKATRILRRNHVANIVFSNEAEDLVEEMTAMITEEPAPVPVVDKEQQEKELDALLQELDESATCPPSAPVASDDAESIYDDWVIMAGHQAVVIGRFSDENAARQKWMDLHLKHEHANLSLTAPRRLEKDPSVVERDARMMREAVEQDGRRLAASAGDVTVKEHLAELDVAEYQRKLEAMSYNKLRQMIKDAIGFTNGYPNKESCIWLLVKRFEVALQQKSA